VLTYEDPQPLLGRFVGIGALGATVDLAAAEATCAHANDWTFSKAPVQFRLARGLWEIEPHWACTGKAAHFYGLDEYGAAVLRTKDAFEGDLVLEAILSNADFQVRAGERIPKSLGVTIGGDGANLSSGCSFVLGAGDPRETLLLHGGQVLARSPSHTVRKAEHNANNWLEVRLEKTGSTVRLSVEGEVECEHTFDAPLPPGQVAFWSYGGGLVLRRVRLWYERPQPEPPMVPARLEVDRLLAQDPSGDAEAQAAKEPVREVWLDFEKDHGSVVTRDTPDSALATLDNATAASGKCSLRIVNPSCGGNFALWVTSTPVRFEPGTRLEFDYRVPADAKLNLYLKRDARWYEVGFTGGTKPKPDDVRPVADVPNVVADGQWHHARVELFEVLVHGEKKPPEAVIVDEIAFASPTDFLFRCGFTGNPFGATWWLDNVRVVENPRG